MERGAIGELIPEEGRSGELTWGPKSNSYTDVFGKNGRLLATFYGDKPIRLERVALFLTTEQS